MGFVLRLIANTLAILIVAWMLDGIIVADAVAGILAGLVLALVNAVVKPILLILTLPLTLLTLGLFYALDHLRRAAHQPLRVDHQRPSWNVV